MSINKRLIIFNSVIMILSMTLVLLVSNYALNKMLENSVKNYLKTSVYAAMEIQDARLNEMENGASLIIRLDDVSENYLAGNQDNLSSSLSDLKQELNYLDLGMFVDVSGNVLAHMEKNADRAGKIALPYIEKAPDRAIKTQSEIDLRDIFETGSGQAENYAVTLESTGDICYDGLMAIVISPVKDGGGHILGYLMLGDIINKNSYYTTQYSEIIPDSYLTISLDDLRICSNIFSKDKSDYTGTTIPDITQDTLTKKEIYFGSEYAPIGDNYFFLYKPLEGYFGEFQGYLSVGIPENIFMKMLSVNQKIVISIICITFFVILVSSILFGKSITKPIRASADIARNICRGDFKVAHNYGNMKNLSCETRELLVAMEEMANTLYKNKMDIEQYIDELVKKHKEADSLSQQLLEMNSTLEQMVDARTIELRQIIEELKESNMVKSRFLANISHELKTPLTGSINASELLLDELFGTLNERQTKYVKNIWLSSNQLLLLINDILDLSKINAGKLNVNPAVCFVNEVLEEAIGIVKSTTYKKSIELITSVTPDELEVWADKQLLKQVLYNLLSNAIKFSNENSTVSVSAGNVNCPENSRTYVRFCVSDQGIGIAKKDLERVFVEFEQTDNSYSREYGGTGLGLPLSKKWVELQGGKMELHSELNVGTEVIFYLPATEEQEV